MPSIDVASTIAVEPEFVWQAMLDIETFPEYMENVIATEIVSQERADHRISRWSASLKGSVLEWVEDERIDHAARMIEFHQLDGDLEVFAGTWSVIGGPDGTTVRLTAEFEIGIPLLADMLNPVAARALRDNQEQMLDALERRLLAEAP